MRLAIVLGICACGDDALVPAVPAVSGDASLVLSDDGQTLTFSRGETTLLTFHADAFAVGTVDALDRDASYDPYWLYVDQPPEPPAGLAFGEASRMTVVSSAPDSLVLQVGDAHVVFAPTLPGAFSAVLTPTSSRAAYLRMRADADPQEGFYGLGEWGDTVMHRGKLRAMQMEADLESESGDIENHVPVPLVIGTRGWGVFAKSVRPGAFDVARQTDTRIDIAYGTGASSADGLEMHLFSADHPLDILLPYFGITGTPGLPATWAYGPLLWRDETVDQAQALDDIQQIRSRKLAVSGVWFDRPYATGVQTFDWNPAKFSDPTAMLRAHHDAGLRYGIWQAPYTAPSDNADPAQPTLDVATQMGFFPPTTGLLLNKWGKPIDFTNAAAYAWWQDNLRTYTRSLDEGGFGVEGFKLDYAEDVVVGINGIRTPWKFADGSDESTMHHGYTLLYHQIHRELLPEDGGFLLTRTGRWGDQTQGMIVWPGDLNASFIRQGEPLDNAKAVGGLPTALAFGIGLSASGFPFYASDTGGYRQSPANNECWLRWVQANAIGSAMQIGDSSSQLPWEFTVDNGRDQHSVDIYARYTLLHLRLFPYAWSYAAQIATTGRPITRPFGLAYPDAGAHPSDQFGFGDHLLVAPVIEAGQTAREVVFPAGDWIGWWDGAVYTGTRSVPADLDTLPLFVARGGIVPMLRDTIETLAPVQAGSAIDSFASDPGILTVRVAPGPATEFVVFDGTTITQENGTILSYVPGTAFTRGALFEVIARPRPMGVSGLTEQASLAALQAAADGWFWEPATGGTLWIKVAGMATVTVE